MKSINSRFLSFTRFIILCNVVYEVLGAGNETKGKRRASDTEIIDNSVSSKPNEHEKVMCIESLTIALGGKDNFASIIYSLLYKPYPINYNVAKSYGMFKTTNSNLAGYVLHIQDKITSQDIINYIDSNTPYNDLDLMKKHLKVTSTSTMIKQFIISMDFTFDPPDEVFNSRYKDLPVEQKILKFKKNFYNLLINNTNIAQGIMSIKNYCEKEYERKYGNKSGKKSSNKNKIRSKIGSESSNAGGFGIDLNLPTEENEIDLNLPAEENEIDLNLPADEYYSINN